MIKKLTITDLLVLGTLYKSPLYGYELKRIVDEWHVELWAGITLSSIYHSLKKLEKLNLVVKDLRQKGHMELRVYKLTDSGIEAFFELEFELLASFETTGPQFGIPVLFIEYLSEERQLQALKRRRSEIELRLLSYEKCTGNVSDVIRKNDYSNIKDYLLWFYDEHIKWTDQHIDILENK
jgi:DNA-binding PadR family transcriptional regulator